MLDFFDKVFYNTGMKKSRDQVMVNSDNFNSEDAEVLLNNLLEEVRLSFNADASVVYLHESGRLSMRYVKTKIKLKNNSNTEFAFLSFDVNANSIAGYTVMQRDVVYVSDVHSIPKNASYKLHNQIHTLLDFELKNVLSLPLISASNEVLGVFQLLGAKSENNEVLDFTNKDDFNRVSDYSGNIVTLLDKSKVTRALKLQKIMESERALNSIQDIDIFLEALLSEARSIVNADAGSIYVLEDNILTIRNAQNDTQLKALGARRKLPFSSFSFDVNEKSIAGYCVVSRSFLNIPDVYNIPEHMPYTFNKGPDTATGYKTKTMLTIPLITHNSEIIGVLQIINPLDSEGNVIDFSADAEFYLQHFAYSATKALERTKLTRAMVMRMIRMAGFRDPKETGPHVNRVASYAVEIYDQWAENHYIDAEVQKKFRDNLKIAAMLHDVGKVGIPDQILKSEKRYNQEEYDIIRTHACIGAMLFGSLESTIDEMSCDVALHHHERWDGTGYPGRIDVKNATMDNTYSMLDGEPLKGEEIPLAARIVSLADVYDALSSKRVYKEAWDTEDVLEEIKLQSGKQFDPEIVKAFLQVQPEIEAIHKSWPSA